MTPVALTALAFAPHPDPAAFRPVADPAAFGWRAPEHPPVQGPFGPADDSVVVFAGGSVRLFRAPVPSDPPVAVASTDAERIATVWFEDLDDDTHLEMVLLGGVGQVPANRVVDWTGRELVTLRLLEPAATAFDRATDAAAARAALKLRQRPCVPTFASGCGPDRPCCDSLLAACAPDGVCKVYE